MLANLLHGPTGVAVFREEATDDFLCCGREEISASELGGRKYDPPSFERSERARTAKFFLKAPCFSDHLWGIIPVALVIVQ